MKRDCKKGLLLVSSLVGFLCTVVVCTKSDPETYVRLGHVVDSVCTYSKSADKNQCRVVLDTGDRVSVYFLTITGDCISKRTKETGHAPYDYRFCHDATDLPSS